MRAGRLLQLLLLLQARGRLTAPALADALEVSVRTVYRDVEALASAGVPVFTETGRNGGISLLPGYRPGGLPPLTDSDARAILLTGTPGVAASLGLDTADAQQALLRSMPPATEAAARSLGDRLLVEPAGWWEAADDVPLLPVVARAVWDDRLLRITYREHDRTVTPLGLVIKGGAWYLLTDDRTYRVSRITAAEVLAHRVERPAAFDLAAAWEARKSAFVQSIPTYWVTARVSPAGERLLGLLQEGTPALPLPDDVRRDDEGWAHLRLRFERLESAGRLLLQLGAEVEVLRPAPLRRWMAGEVTRLAVTYG